MLMGRTAVERMTFFWTIPSVAVCWCDGGWVWGAMGDLTAVKVEIGMRIWPPAVTMGRTWIGVTGAGAVCVCVCVCV